MYNKLFTKILDSSIWLENHATRIVWISMLASMDEDGFCHFASIGNVAQRAVVTREEAEKAIGILEAPDKESSDPACEGRRLERVPGGWMVLNAPKYREMATREQAKEHTRERVRRFRERNGTVTPCNESVTTSEAYTNTETKNLRKNKFVNKSVKPVKGECAEHIGMGVTNVGECNGCYYKT